jgi:hypothetical protein
MTVERHTDVSLLLTAPTAIKGYRTAMAACRSVINL